MTHAQLLVCAATLIDWNVGALWASLLHCYFTCRALPWPISTAERTPSLSASSMRLLPLLTLSLTAVTSLRACTLVAPLAPLLADVRAADDARFISQPSPRAGAVVALTANATTLLFGGVLSSGELALPSVYEFNAGLNRWAQLTDGTATSPASRTGHCGGWLADSMVVFGGRDANGSPLADAWLFAPVTQRWTRLQMPGVTPPPRAGHSCLVFNRTSLLGACSLAL